jgi:methionyl-tRNA synthetase
LGEEAGRGKELVLPYDVPANEFMNLENRKISGSRNWAVWGLDFLSRYDPDPLRYYLTVNMPETRDTMWDWEDFLHRNNGELVATWGNLVHRVLSFTHKHWEGRIPRPGALRAVDKEILAAVDAGFQKVGARIEKVQLRAALAEAMALASEANKYLERTSPWLEIKTDKQAAATTMWTALQVVNALKVLFAPFLPHTSEALHAALGYEKPLFGQQVVVLGLDVLEHVTADGVDLVHLAVGGHQRDHPGHDLVALAALVVQRVHLQGQTATDGEAVNGFAFRHGLPPNKGGFENSSYCMAWLLRI